MKYLAIVHPVTALLWFVHYTTSTIHDGGKKFEEIKFHVFSGQMLSATTSGVAHNTIKVRDRKDCVVSCTDVPWCRSVNVKITPESDGLHVCELISVDNFTNHKDLKNNASFVHYSMKNPCEEGPCPNFTVCTVQGNRQTFTCLCKRGFTGEKCEIEIDYCKSSPCMHGATCATDLDSNRYVCTCADRYLGTNCQKNYHKESSMAAQAVARTTCQSLGADIPTIHSAEENELVRLLVLKVDRWMWIGLVDSTNSNNPNNFRWINGNPVNYTNWNANVNTETGDCVLMDGAGVWHLHNCAWSNGVGCFLNWIAMGNSAHSVSEPEDLEEHVQPHESERKRETSGATRESAGIETHRSRYIGVLSSDTAQTRVQSGSGGPGQIPGTGRPWDTMPGRVQSGSGGQGQIPGTGRPWETMPGREQSGRGGPGQIPGTGRPWETMPGRVEPSSGGPGQIPGTGRPWETVPGRVQSGSGGPGQIPGTGRPWETMPGRVEPSSGGPGQIPGTGRPWETMPGRVEPSSGGPGQIPGTGRPWETVPGRVEPSSGGPGQIPGTGRPWETVPGRVQLGSGGPGQIPGTGRPWETMTGRVEPSSGGPGQIPGTGRPWETVPGRVQLGSGGPEQIPGTGRPWETMPGREQSGRGGPGQIPGTGRPWETMPGREQSGRGGPGQIPGTARPWETMPSPGTSSESRPKLPVPGSKRETHRERLKRERKTIDGQIEDAKARINQKMMAVEGEIKTIQSIPLSPGKKEEIGRRLVTAKEHFLKGLQNVHRNRDATFGRLLRKIEEVENPRMPTSKMDWEELDDLVVNMMMFYSEFISELEELEKLVNEVKQTRRPVPMPRSRRFRGHMPPPTRAPSTFPEVEMLTKFSSMQFETSSSFTGPKETVITLNENGGFFNLSNFGLFLQVPPNTVSHQTNITCTLRSKQFLPSPAGEMETVVSHIVELGPQNLPLRQPIVATLLHSGPGRGYGYETIVKAFSQEQLVWEELQEYKSSEGTLCPIDYIGVKIAKLTVLAVISRLVTDRFKVTPRGCLVTSSIWDGITLQFPEGAVTRNVSGSLQVLTMPKLATNGFPCPILFVNGFEGINFQNYVLVRIPHPCPQKYPVGQIDLMCLKQNQWTNQTDQVICVEHQYYIELHVQHFSDLWAWLLAVPSNFIALFRYLCHSPQSVCFAAFKEKLQPSLLPKITLLCVANHDDERMQKMEVEGYGRLARTTARKKMRPNDNAFMKMDGNYRAHARYRDFSLEFLDNEPCIRELSIERRQESHGVEDNAIFWFYLSNAFAEDDLICVLDVKQGGPEKRDRMELIREALEMILVETENVPRQIYNEKDSDDEQGNQITDIVRSFGAEERLLTLSAEEVAQQLPIYLNVSRVDQQDPPPHVMKQCRIFCRTLKELGRQDVVEALRKFLPAGMTGPLSNGNTLVKNMESDRKTILTRHLSVTEKWKPLAQELGATGVDIKYYEAKTQNHSMAVLKEYGAHLTVNQLYKLLVRIGANAVADHL